MLCAEANVFALASHIYWGVWAVVQARATARARLGWALGVGRAASLPLLDLQAPVRMHDTQRPLPHAQQARYSPIEFDYMGYHHLRFAEMRRRKGEFLAQAATAFGGGAMVARAPSVPVTMNRCDAGA